MAETMDKVGVTFVNTVTNQGVQDGVFNINFATALFSPVGDDKIEADLTISCRLLMGPQCLMQLKAAVDFLVNKYMAKPIEMPDAEAVKESGVAAASKPN